jgi:hypothetical protein
MDLDEPTQCTIQYENTETTPPHSFPIKLQQHRVGQLRHGVSLAMKQRVVTAPRKYETWQTILAFGIFGASLKQARKLQAAILTDQA